MQASDDTQRLEWDVPELKRRIDEWDDIASQIIELLHATADCARSENWRPHSAQIVNVMHRFRALCQAEREQLGCWRQDGLQPVQAYDLVWHQGDQLVKWLNRMLQN